MLVTVTQHCTVQFVIYEINYSSIKFFNVNVNFLLHTLFPMYVIYLF